MAVVCRRSIVGQMCHAHGIGGGGLWSSARPNDEFGGLSSRVDLGGARSFNYRLKCQRLVSASYQIRQLKQIVFINNDDTRSGPHYPPTRLMVSILALPWSPPATHIHSHYAHTNVIALPYALIYPPIYVLAFFFRRFISICLYVPSAWFTTRTTVRHVSSCYIASPRSNFISISISIISSLHHSCDIIRISLFIFTFISPPPAPSSQQTNQLDSHSDSSTWFSYSLCLLNPPLCCHSFPLFSPYLLSFSLCITSFSRFAIIHPRYHTLPYNKKKATTTTKSVKEQQQPITNNKKKVICTFKFPRAIR